MKMMEYSIYFFSRLYLKKKEEGDTLRNVWTDVVLKKID